MIPVVYELGKTRLLKLDFRAIIKLEAIFGSPMTKWQLDALTFSEIANILAESMRLETKDITTEDVIDLIENHSDYQEAFEKAYECITAAFAKNVPAVKKAPPKVKVENGTGK